MMNPSQIYTNRSTGFVASGWTFKQNIPLLLLHKLDSLEVRCQIRHCLLCYKTSNILFQNMVQMCWRIVLKWLICSPYFKLIPHIHEIHTVQHIPHNTMQVIVFQTEFFPVQLSQSCKSNQQPRYEEKSFQGRTYIQNWLRCQAKSTKKSLYMSAWIALIRDIKGNKRVSTLCQVDDAPIPFSTYLCLITRVA